MLNQIAKNNTTSGAVADMGLTQVRRIQSQVRNQKVGGRLDKNTKPSWGYVGQFRVRVSRWIE